MPSFKQTVVEILRKRGPTEIRSLVKICLKSISSARDEAHLIQSVFYAATLCESGLAVAEYPTYRLLKPVTSEELPAGKYARAAILALRESKMAVALPVLVQYYGRQYAHSARCPEFWMWCAIERELSRVVVKRGNLRIGLREVERPEKSQRVLAARKTSSPSSVQEPISRHIDEKSLETMLANRPDLIEPGLTLFQRQCRIPVGVIDLLFLDRRRNYVVVEIKRPSADYREVVGQITTVRDRREYHSQGALTEHLHVNIIRIWRRPAADVLSKGGPALFPWTALMDATVEQQQEAARRVKRTGRQGLQNQMALLGSLRYGSREAFFRRVGRMFLTKQILRETPMWQEIEQEGRAEGIAQGMTQGLADGERRALRRFLTGRFGPLPQWAEDKLNSAAVDTLERWSELAASAPSLPAVLD